MEFRIPLTKIETSQDVAKLVSAISDLAKELEVIYTETAPNGSLSGRIGQIAIYNNSGTYTTWINTDGSTTWQQIDATTDLTVIGSNVIPSDDNTYDLGSLSKQWKDLYINGLAYIDQLGENLDFNDQQAVNFILENRTDDTGMTVTGQMWFRTD